MPLNLFPRSKSAIFGTAITVLWIVMMISLFRNHVQGGKWKTGPSGSMDDITKLTENWHDVKEHMVLRLGSSPIGAASTIVRLEKKPRRHFVAEFRLGAKLGIAFLNRSIQIKGAAILDGFLSLQRFHAIADIPGGQVRLTGLFRGNVLYLRSEGAKGPVLSRIDMGKPVTFLEAVRPTALSNVEIKTGTVVKLPVADPVLSMQQGELTLIVKDLEEIEVGGKKVWAHRVEMRLNNIVTTCWVDSEGATLKRQLIGSLMMEKSTEDMAAKLSPVINESIPIPELDTEDFRDIPIKPAKDFVGGSESPLGLLSTP